MGRSWRPVATAALAVGLVACAGRGQIPDRPALDAAIRTRALSGIRVDSDARLPPDASIEDGVTSQEAVAIALWNSPSFQLTLADLGIARADLVEAGLLRNPIFSLLFPVGPKQLEWTLQVPFEAFWQRPRRVAAARLNAQAVGERLVWEALSLVAQTRAAHADAVIADRRLQLATENANLVQRLAGITEARFKAGDISEVEARSARNDAARVQVLRQAVEYDRIWRGSRWRPSWDLTRLPISSRSRRMLVSIPARVVLPRSDSGTRWRRAPTCAPRRSGSKPPRNARGGNVRAS